jgi:hypothetical protein
MAQTKPTAKVAKPAAAVKPAAAPAGKVKADGTPDMRFKENKEAAKAAAPGPKKADGTPDMRYKENKAAAKPAAADKAAPKKKG